MHKYRKKPVEIEAIQLTDAPESLAQICSWMDTNDGKPLPDHNGEEGHCIRIPTLEGIMTANIGDWIIRGVAGEFYPCKPDIFDATYEAV